MRCRQLVICAATVLITACSGGPEPAEDVEAPPPRDEEAAGDEDATASDTCNQAFADAEAGDAELQATLTACEDIATFRAAAADYPELLDDTDPSVWLAEACTEANAGEGGDSPLCDEVAGEQQ